MGRGGVLQTSFTCFVAFTGKSVTHVIHPLFNALGTQKKYNRTRTNLVLGAPLREHLFSTHIIAHHYHHLYFSIIAHLMDTAVVLSWELLDDLQVDPSKPTHLAHDIVATLNQRQ